MNDLNSSTNLPILSRLLLDVCRRDCTAATLSQHATFLSDDRFRASLIDFAGRHGVLGLMLVTWQRLTDFRDLPQHVADELREQLRANRRRAMLLELERNAVLATLRRAGLEALVLKGAGLATTVYRDSVERNYGDIDLLFPLDDVERALDVLGQSGFTAASDRIAHAQRSHHFHVRVTNARDTIVEVHWGITTKKEAIHLDPGEYLRESAMTSGANPLRVPRIEHSLLHIVAENARDSLTRLTRIVDIDRIVANSPSLDWNYVEKVARKSGLEYSLALVLALSKRMLGTDVPADTLARVRPPLAVRIHLELLRPAYSLLEQRAFRRASWGELMSLWLLSGRSKRTAVFDMLRADSGEPLQWLWNGGDSDEGYRAPNAIWRVTRVAKIVSYQLGTYVVQLPMVRPRKLAELESELW